MSMKIGELAKIAGCQVVTIRYYEKEGLLPEPERTGSNYRLYRDEDVKRLRFIKHCRRHNIKLSDIRELLVYKDNPRSDCDWINALVDSQINSAKEQIESLTQLKEELEQLRHKCSSVSQNGCGILRSLTEPDGCTYCENFQSYQKKRKFAPAPVPSQAPSSSSEKAIY